MHSKLSLFPFHRLILRFSISLSRRTTSPRQTTSFFRLLLWLRAHCANTSCRSRRHCRLTADKYFFSYYFCISIFLSLRSLGRHSMNRRKLIKKPVFFLFISVVMARCAKREIIIISFYICACAYHSNYAKSKENGRGINQFNSI